MGDRYIRDRDRDREDRDLDRGRDRRERSKDRDRDRDRDRPRRPRSPDRTRSQHTRSRTRSPDRPSKEKSRSPSRHRHRSNRSPSPDPHRRHHRRRDEKDDKDHRQRAAAVVSEFVDDIVREHKKRDSSEAPADATAAGVEGEVDTDEIEMMKKLGIPTGFDSTKGKPVPGADVSGIRAVTKRQPRQYMNRRGGFNRPLPPEVNR